MGPPPRPSSTSRQSLAGGPGVANRATLPTTKTTTGRASLAPKSRLRPGERVGSIGSQLSSGQASEGSGHDTGDEDRGASPVKSDNTDSFSPKPMSPILARTSAAARQHGSPASTQSTASPGSQRAAGGSTASSREIEALKTKLRVMEQKRLEDREKLKALDKIQAERDKYESIIQKLQNKYQKSNSRQLRICRQNTTLLLRWLHLIGKWQRKQQRF
jgi:dynactin 1